MTVASSSLRASSLDLRVINLFRIPVDGTDFGYTGVSYSLCVAEPATP
jgi:hypothetical protein